MSTSSALIKSILHKALADGVYKDITTKTSQYYYFLGKTLEWDDETAPPVPFDSIKYENTTRNEIITLKQISPSDVSFVIPRINWTSGEVYDMYDDQYSTEILGIDVIDGGTGFTSLPTITITGGGGTGAKFYPIVLDGQIIGIENNEELRAQGILNASNGTGYTSEPTVTLSGGAGTGAILAAKVNIAPSGAQRLEDCLFYVMTEDYNVYKCLDNNNGAQSINKPLGTSVNPIVTSDGYVWKYMYTVPINLRTKFLSDDYIPVISALTNQFYSNGSVDSINIINKGIDYTYANISVVGDGYIESDPTLLSSVTINDGGSGYVTPIVTFGAPINSDVTEFAAEIGVFLGQYISNSTNDFYIVVAPGTLGTSEPTHRFRTIQNGSAALKYLGTTVTGTVNLDGDAIDSITLNGAVYDITMTNGGSGYISAPTVSFSGGNGATAVAKLYNDSVIYCSVVEPGDFTLTSEPTVTIGTTWTASTVVYVNDQIAYGANLYTVTAAGTTHASTAPTHTSGSASNGTATLAYAGIRATATAILRYGAGYNSAPSITIEDDGGMGSAAEASWLTSKSEAKLLPVIDNGQIIEVVVKESGIGYSVASITVTGDGENAEITADLSVGSIQTLQANNEILVEAGTINAIGIISGGYGYGVANLEIQGDGSGCTAESVLNTATGAIEKVIITNPGSGYTYANIVITGNGHAANLRAIISPYGGHGKNSPDELCARTLVFYSNVSTDLNQGLAVNNDYRQVGIIKNPRKFQDTARFTNQIGSACYLVQGDINPDYFPRDTNITVTRIIDDVEFERSYRVVSSTSSAALIQSLDNDVPQTNDTFINDANQTFNVSSVTSPTVDKYSGQLMFIDNKAGFTPSTDETVTLRTVIQF